MLGKAAPSEIVDRTGSMVDGADGGLNVDSDHSERDGAEPGSEEEVLWNDGENISPRRP